MIVLLGASLRAYSMPEKMKALDKWPENAGAASENCRHEGNDADLPVRIIEISYRSYEISNYLRI